MGQNVHHGMGWVGFGWSLDESGWVEKIGPTDNSGSSLGHIDLEAEGNFS